MPDTPKNAAPKPHTPRPGQQRPARKPAPAAPRPAAPISPAREAAFELLQRIGATSAHSDDLLHGPRLAALSQVDKDLTTALVLGVLRWQIALDARIRSLLSRDLRPPEPVLIALRLGAFQLLHMERIPAHAALNESVELVRAAGQPQAAGMVNAILRKLVDGKPTRKPLVEPLPAMAERLAHPAWLVERWAAQYGRQAAEAVCEFDQRQPGCATIFDAASADPDAPPMPVMDAGSRLVAELAAAARPDAQRVWDCCAAPGGKAVVLGRRLPQAELLATDSSPMRLKRLGQRLGRELPGQNIRVELANAAELPSSQGQFELILCDVPCSGTGTLARNPETRHRLQPFELKRQAERQTRILAGALEHLAPGGVLVYSTCSLEAEECEAVVDAELAAGSGLRQIAIMPTLQALRTSGRLHADDPVLERWTKKEYLRTLPGSGFDGDGFFAAILTRD